VEYYPDRPELDSYVVSWSSRSQKRVLASCNIRRRRVVVARELFEPTACQWIAPVLYHELCHAVIGEGVHLQGGKRQWHGAEFRTLEARHPDIPAMNAWIRSGGWAMAVRSHRARQAWSRRKAANE
jgi:predicted SprT family Zn-dependent metalloprotease